MSRVGDRENVRVVDGALLVGGRVERKCACG